MWASGCQTNQTKYSYQTNMYTDAHIYYWLQRRTSCYRTLCWRGLDWYAWRHQTSVEEENLKEHRYGRRNTYRSENSRVNPLYEPDGRGIALCKQIAEGTSSKLKQYAPAEAHPFLEHGRCKLLKEHHKDYDGIFDSPIPFTSFENYHISKSKNKAPGVSEVAWIM